METTGLRERLATLEDKFHRDRMRVQELAQVVELSPVASDSLGSRDEDLREHDRVTMRKKNVAVRMDELAHTTEPQVDHPTRQRPNDTNQATSQRHL